MELRHLHYFAAVAEELHFGKAAQKLGMTQPPLSQQIQRLEEELGVQLFRRTKRRVELTEAGQAFLPEVRQALAKVEQAVTAARRAGRGEIGRLAVGFVGSASYEILPAMIRRFHECFPDVELVLRELTTSQQVRALHEGRIHVGLLRPPVSDGTLMIESFLTEPLIAVLPETHALAGQPAVSLQELARERFITFPRHLGPGLYDQIISICQQAGFSPEITQEAVQMQTILGLVATGIGIALIPASARNLRSSGVAYSELQRVQSGVEMALAWRKDNASPTLRAFLGMVRNSVEEG
ncbi:MAG TPA: LysR family transcriptional regulator [Ktedonobacteraceae bacterium]|nr:LysR family transcriptional regulator [Ktedonobacteraceae bacterium]